MEGEQVSINREEESLDSLIQVMIQELQANHEAQIAKVQLKIESEHNEKIIVLVETLIQMEEREHRKKIEKKQQGQIIEIEKMEQQHRKRIDKMKQENHREIEKMEDEHKKKIEEYRSDYMKTYEEHKARIKAKMPTMTEEKIPQKEQQPEERKLYSFGNEEWSQLGGISSRRRKQGRSVRQMPKEQLQFKKPQSISKRGRHNSDRRSIHQIVQSYGRLSTTTLINYQQIKSMTPIQVRGKNKLTYLLKNICWYDEGAKRIEVYQEKKIIRIIEDAQLSLQKEIRVTHRFDDPNKVIDIYFISENEAGQLHFFIYDCFGLKKPDFPIYIHSNHQLEHFVRLEFAFLGDQ